MSQSLGGGMPSASGDHVEDGLREASDSTPIAPPAIRVRHLWHRYGSFDVLRDVSFEVGHGEIFGFIGPNGAGKTTTISIMATLLEPMAGRVEIDGIDVAIDPDEVRKIIGYMPDHAGVYDRISVREYLEFFADSFRVENIDVVDAVIELTDLGNLQTRLVSALSKGMKQRLQLARILLHDPKVLILDEPASDLDPRARIEIRDLLLELRELGKTVFLSSHILTELSDVCTSVGILEKGQLVIAGPIGEIAERLEARSRAAAIGHAPVDAGPSGAAVATAAAVAAGAERRTQGGATVPGTATKRLKLRVLGDARQVIPLVEGGGGVVGVEATSGGQVVISHTGGDRFVADVVRHLVGHGVLLVGVEPERNELERIFLEYTRGDLQ
ncbi:MAG: ABC transporter ATP-binding protein [Polyangiaceae bacterium]